MNKIMEWFSKRKVFIIALLSTVVFFVLLPKQTLSIICDSYNSTCIDLVGYFLLIFMIGVTILIPSIILLFLKQEIFDFWKKTLYIYLFIYLLVIILTPWYIGDGFFHIQKDIIALILSILYFFISFILIIFKSLEKEKREKGVRNL